MSPTSAPPTPARAPPASANQNSIQVDSSGVVDLATNSQSALINGLTLEVGRVFSGMVATGAGVLTIDSDVVVNQAFDTDGSSPAASISGLINLTGGLDNIENPQQQFIVSQTFIPSDNSDLNVLASIGQTTPSLDPNAANDGAVGLYMPGLRRIHQRFQRFLLAQQRNWQRL